MRARWLHAGLAERRASEAALKRGVSVPRRSRTTSRLRTITKERSLTGKWASGGRAAAGKGAGGGSSWVAHARAPRLPASSKVSLGGAPRSYSGRFLSEVLILHAGLSAVGCPFWAQSKHGGLECCLAPALCWAGGLPAFPCRLILAAKKENSPLLQLLGPTSRYAK